MSTTPETAPAADHNATTAIPEPGYDKWLAGEIAGGLADIEAGRVTPADKVRSEFDFE